MSMTVKALHNQLGKLIKDGHGRKPVCVNKTSFHHVLEEDGAVIFDIDDIRGPIFVYMTDDDGGTKFNKDGSESGRYTVILDGGYREN